MINFKQEQLVEEVLNYVTEKFPEVKLLNVTESPEDPKSYLEVRVVLIVRPNYAPWVRNDHTGFELMLGDMATFTQPEKTAEMARPFWIFAD